MTLVYLDRAVISMLLNVMCVPFNTKHYGYIVKTETLGLIYLAQVVEMLTYNLVFD